MSSRPFYESDSPRGIPCRLSPDSEHWENRSRSLSGQHSRRTARQPHGCFPRAGTFPRRRSGRVIRGRVGKTLGTAMNDSREARCRESCDASSWPPRRNGQTEVRGYEEHCRLFKPHQYCASSRGTLRSRARGNSSGWEPRNRRKPGVSLRRRNASVR